MATTIVVPTVVPKVVPIPDGVKKAVREYVARLQVNGLHILLTDYVIKQRPDDNAYKQSPELWRHVPRGCADVSVKSMKDGHDVWTGYLRGFPKFGYEEDAERWGFATPTKSSTTNWVFTTKENGECFHFMCSERLAEANGRVFVFGSKNVHAAVFFEHDNEFWSTNTWPAALRQKSYAAERYGYAFQLVQQFISDISAKPGVQSQWTQFLDNIQNRTVVIEACDPSRAEHLVRYDRPLMACLGIRSPFAPCFVDGNPLDQRRMFQQFGFDVPRRCVSIKADDVETIRRTQEDFACEENSEGTVRYVCDPHNNVTMMVKEKNYKYVYDRAVREKIKQGVSSSALLQRIRKLHVPYDKAYEARSLRFNAWVQMQRQKNLLRDVDVDQHYMTVERQFEQLTAAEQQDALEKWDKQAGGQKLVIVVGAPCQGSGKTTFSNTLVYVLNSSTELAAVRISQDDCGNRPKFLEALKAANDDVKVSAVVIDKWNDRGNRADYFGLFPDGLFVFIGFQHPADTDNDTHNHLVQHCFNRVRQRGNKHPMLHSSDMEDGRLRGLLRSFATKWKWPDASEEAQYLALMSLSVLDSTAAQVAQVMEDLQKAHLVELRSCETTSLVELRSCETTTNLSAHIAAGLNAHAKYEETFTRQQQQHHPRQQPPQTLYWKVALSKQQVMDAWTQLGVEYQPKDVNFQVLSSFHVTLVYFNHRKKMSAEEKTVVQQLDATWAAREHDAVAVELEELVYDNKAFAFRVRLTEDLKPTTQHALHVTLAHMPNVRPVYSNDMMEHPIYTKRFDRPVRLQGTIERVLVG